MKNKIELYRDENLLVLAKKILMLDEEKTRLISSDKETENKDRTYDDVIQDMIKTYNEINKYLETNYPNNIVANSWIHINQSSIGMLK